MIGTWTRIVVTLLACTLVSTAAFGQNEEVVASLQRLTGLVDVVQAKTGEKVKARVGLLLRGGDTVITAKDSRATIKFRDGSEIRLFQNTNFLVESKEVKGPQRFFKVNLFMKLGAFWGHFVKQRQIAQIGTPTATIGIKGTTLRVVELDDKGRVALTEGSIEVKNDRTSVVLEPGKRLVDFTRTDILTDKVQAIPLKLDLASEQRELEFPNNQPREVFLTVQLIEVKTGKPVNRSGRLYLRSNYERITYPPMAQLDQRGTARVALQIAPPQPADAVLNGNVYVWALIDQEDADDTAEGRILFKIPVPPSQDRIRVESQTGEGQRVQ